MSIENISKLIANYVTPNNINDKDHVEVVTYGVGAVLTSVINIAIALMIHIILGRQIELLKVLLFFLPLRVIHKGFHCKTFLKCLLTTNFLMYGITYLSVMLVIDKNIMFVIFVSMLLMQVFLSYEHNVKVMVIYLTIYLLSFFLNIQLEMFMLSALTMNLILIIGRRSKDDFRYKRIFT